jgi:phosphatidylglycerophosphate synthase
VIDAALLPLQRRLLAGPAKVLARMGATADGVSILGFGLGLLALPMLWLNIYPFAMLFLALNRICDGLDGALARLQGPTDRGAFLDIAMDFLFYAAFPLGFAFADPTRNALPAALLITAFVGTGSSFLAFASIAAKRGMTTADYPSKGIYYLGGITEGFETIAVFTLMCLFPAAFPPLAVIFALACFVTTGLRWRQGYEAFSE